MRPSRLAALLLTNFVLNLPLHAAPDMSAVEKDYLKKCGGKSYSNCDGKDGQDGLTQETLFQTAEAAAVTSKKLVFVVFGADWCPSCRTLSRDFAENPALRQRLERGYLTVNLNGQLASAKRVAKKLEVNIVGFPQAVIFDPAANKSLEKFFATSKGSSEQLVAYLENFATTRQAGANEGKIRESLLARPVAKPGRFGESNFTPSTQLTGAQKDEFISLMRQGMLYFHAFHWINATRSFHSALRLEKNPVAMALLALSRQEAFMFASAEDLMLAVEAEHLAQDSAWVDADDKHFARFVRVAVADMTQEMCKIRREGQATDAWNAARSIMDKHKLTKVDYLAVIGWKAWHIGALEQAYDLQPKHGGLNHYLTHRLEGNGKIAAAAGPAELYASLAPDSAHAQHMHGHILPQLGKWEEAAAAFKRAHEIHLREFRDEGILKSEDWHYPHNLDLLTSTLVYLGRMDEALALAKEDCSAESKLTCWQYALLKMANGGFEAGDKIVASMKSSANSTTAMAMRIMAALGQGKLNQAEPFVASLKRTDDWDETSYAAIAYGLITKSMKSEDVLQVIQKRLARPGFDAWSVGVISSRVLIKVLEVNGFSDVAAKIKDMAIAAYENKVCKTELCRKP